MPARVAFDDNLTPYRQQIAALFWLNPLLIASNGTDSRSERCFAVAIYGQAGGQALGRANSLRFAAAL